jgi:hypothetical protein
LIPGPLILRYNPDATKKEDMSYYECPYCKRNAASLMIFCGPFILSGLNKKCPSCAKAIHIRLSSFLSFYIAIIGFLGIFGIVLPLILLKYIGQSAGVLTLGVAILIVAIQFFVPDILNRYFGIKLFEVKK